MSSTRIIRLVVIAGVIAIAAYFVSQSGASDREYVEKIQKVREEKDRTFRGSNSPLPENERADFHGLHYYETDPEYKKRVAWTKLEKAEPYTMQLTGNKTAEYYKYATVEFELKGEPVKLTLFQRPAGSTDRSFFVPFTDATNGHETYGGGRYMDVELVSGGEVEIDFNKAYNPYCAFNPDYSCPIPPADNQLKIAVKAGEKDHH